MKLNGTREALPYAQREHGIHGLGSAWISTDEEEDRDLR